MSQVLKWSITGNCNLRCRHCYISSDKNLYGEISLEQCKEVIRQMLDANIYQVAITGGETLVRKDFWQLIDLFIENKIKIEEIFTNGVAVTEKFLDKLEEKNIRLNCFLVSFDGVGCHDWLKGIKGTEEKTLAEIRLMKKRGCGVIVTTVLHSGNRTQQENNSIDEMKLMQEYFKVLEKYKAEEMPFLSGCGTVEREKETLCETSRIFPHLLHDGKLIPCMPMTGTLMEKIAPNIFNQSVKMALENNATQSARYGLNATDLMLESSMQQIRYQNTEAYYQVLQCLALVNVRQDAVNTLQQHLEKVSIQFEEGIIIKSDVLASQVQLAS